MELSDWFKGFEKGIVKLTAEQREQFFSECGKHCVQCGTLQVYKELYEKANGDIDVFFPEANELPGVRCETIEKGSVYNLYFLEGRIENLTWLSVARYYAEILSARCA